MNPIDYRLINDQELLVTWADGKRCLFAAPYLQLACQCASCVDEITGEQKITATDIDDQVKILGVEPVGNYAVKFQWSSGCQTGIFSFDYLRVLCPKPSQAAS